MGPLNKVWLSYVLIGEFALRQKRGRVFYHMQSPDSFKKSEINVKPICV